MEAFKASTNFATEKAQAMVAFRVSEDFYTDRIMISEEALHKGHKLGQDDCHLQVTTRYSKLDLSFLDE